MAVWTALSYSALEVLSATKLNQNQANFTALVESAASSPIATLGLTVAPGSAIVGLTVDQNYDEVGLKIDSEATTAGKYGLDVYGKWAGRFTHDISGGQALHCTSTVDEAGTNSVFSVATDLANRTVTLVTLKQDNVGSSADVLTLVQDGTGNDMAASNFTLKNGYIAPGGLEAWRCDVVEFDLDGTTPDSVAYTLDDLKCVGIYAIGDDVNINTVINTTEVDNVKYTVPYHDGTDLYIGYGGGYVLHDFARIMIFTIV